MKLETDAARRRELRLRAGLCARCDWLRLLSNGRSIFVQCGKEKEDKQFRRYPPLPVRSCEGFTEGVEDDREDA